MLGNITTVLTPGGWLVLNDQVAPGNTFPWALVALGLGGGGVLVVGGYLVARFLAHRQRANSGDK